MVYILLHDFFFVERYSSKKVTAQWILYKENDNNTCRKVEIQDAISFYCEHKQRFNCSA